MRVSALTPKSGRAASPPTTLQVPAWAKVRAWGVLFSFAAVLALCGTPANPAARSRPARDDRANLWRPPVVVSLSAGAPGWRTAAARGEALPAAGREVFRKPSGLRAHLHVVSGEWEIRRALSPTGCEYGDRCGIYQACTEAALGVSRKCKTFLMAAQPQRADLFCRSRNQRDGPIATVVGYGERGLPDFRSGDTEAASPHGRRDGAPDPKKIAWLEGEPQF